jgi:AcrR family transcriptional regulator
MADDALVTEATQTRARGGAATDGAKTRTRDAEATKARILAAATVEFAAHGIAGARVDRIAATADANKSLIYTYFGNKDALFDAVFEAMVASTVEEIAIDADDLPGFATRVFDHRLAHPELTRLVAWDRLERDGAGVAGEAVQAAHDTKVKAIARAQREGKIASTLAAAALMEFVLAVSETELDLEPGSRAAAAHRKRIAAAVAKLVDPDA